MMVAFLIALPVKSSDPIPLQNASLDTKYSIVAYTIESAQEARIQPRTALNVMRCESNYDPDAVGDHNHSFGLSQINLPSHPDISKEEALDPKFAIEYLTHGLAKKTDHWSCEKEPLP